MSSSSSSNVIGASEHNASTDWSGSFAFSNIGLAGVAFQGANWHKKHAVKLREVFSKLLRDCHGIFLCEVGNLSDPITKVGRWELECVLELAFKDAGAAKHGPPQSFWSRGETMAAFEAGVQVHKMEPLTQMPRVDSWRTVDRFKVTGATEHGAHTLLIYNQHQPSSSQRPFKPNQKISFCTAILEDAVRQQCADAAIIGFGFGGDANCSTAQWIVAFAECKPIRLHYGS